VPIFPEWRTKNKSKSRRLIKRINKTKRTQKRSGGNPTAMEHELLDWIDITKLSSVMLAQNSNPSAIHVIENFPDFYYEMPADSSPGCIGLSENSNATKDIREIS
jgi:hypothetical protein